eukprot:m51a1_g11059 hypothetical protein (697) ;mRNA; f:523435-525602
MEQGPPPPTGSSPEDAPAAAAPAPALLPSSATPLPAVGASASVLPTVASPSAPPPAAPPAVAAPAQALPQTAPPAAPDALANGGASTLQLPESQQPRPPTSHGQEAAHDVRPTTQPATAAATTAALTQPLPPPPMTAPESVGRGPAQDPFVTAMLAREAGAELAFAALEDVVERAAAVIYQRYLGKKVVPFAVDVCMRDLDEVLRCHFVDHDPGERCEADQGALPQEWLGDDEPLPPPIDNWARRVVPVREAPPIARAPTTAAEPAALSATPTVPGTSGTLASATGQSGISRQPSFMSGPPAAVAAAAAAAASAPGTAVPANAASDKVPSESPREPQQAEQHQQHEARRGGLAKRVPAKKNDEAAVKGADKAKAKEVKVDKDKKDDKAKPKEKGRASVLKRSSSAGDAPKPEGEQPEQQQQTTAEEDAAKGEPEKEAGATEGECAAEGEGSKQAKRVKIRSAPEKRKPPSAAAVAAAAAAAKEAEQEAQRQAQMQRGKGLRGKDYTFTHTGEIIAVNPLPPEKLPQNAAYVRAVVVEDAESAANARQQGDRAMASPDTSPRRRARFERSVADMRRPALSSTPTSQFAADSQLHYVPESKISAQPLIDAIKLAPGVTVREGARVKSSVPALPRAAATAAAAPGTSAGVAAVAIASAHEKLSPTHSATTLPPIEVPVAAKKPGTDKVRAMVTLEYLTS